MNNRLLVPVGVFIVWSVICWRWYVCGIKQQCGSAAAQVSSLNQAVPFPVDTFLQENNTDLPVTAVEPLPQPPAPPSPSSITDVTQVSIDEQPGQVLIHFPYNSIRQKDAEAVDEYLTQLANYLKATQQKVTLTGHTDFVGDSKGNYQLGLQRAKAIKKILVNKGVPEENILCRSEGDKRPIASNDNPRGRYKNRRVEIQITP